MTEQEAHPDYRYTLANERTYLAYVRTALALDAAGLAAAQFLTDLGPDWLRGVVATALVMSGVLLSLGAYRRWAANDAAVRRDAPLPATSMPIALAVAAVVISLAALALILTD